LKKAYSSILLIIIFFLFNYLLPVLKVIDLFHVSLQASNFTISYYYDGSVTYGVTIPSPLFKSSLQSFFLSIFTVWTDLCLILIPIITVLYSIDIILSLKNDTQRLYKHLAPFFNNSPMIFYQLSLYLLLILSIGHYILNILLVYYIFPTSAFLVAPSINRFTIILFLIGWSAIYFSFNIFYSEYNVIIKHTSN